MKKRFQPPSVRKLYTIVFFSLFLSFVLSSCSRDDVTGNKLPESSANNNGYKTYGDLVLQKNVIVLNDESVQAITENDQQISFNYTTNQTDSIKEGTVIVATKIENDKIRNILAKVVSVSGAGSQTVFRTTSAKLEEVIYSGNISGVYDPSQQASLQVNGQQANYVSVEGLISQATNAKISNLEAKAVNIRKSADIEKSAISNTINFRYFSFDKTIPLPAQQVGPVTAAADINVKGGFTPKIKYNISFSLGHLSSYYVDFIMDDISLQALANIQGKLGYTLSVTDYINIPIVPIVLGPTGLIISPTIAAGPYVGASATGRVQLQLFSLTGKANFLVGVKPDLNVNLQTITGPKITKVDGELAAEVGVEVKGAVGLQFLTASIANSGVRGRVAAVPSLRLELVPNRSMPFELKGKIQADMFYGFGISPLRYEGTFPLLNKEIPIYKTNLL
ncbi:hypothetical protein [Elizabethkingia anophelis]|uniref:hypothetical protein n=1 Tax=Elizabethkingia anophelis TaxID=1117645 RepID=UPI0012B193E2|nr:hypothetical protein [Elizabethkingia anophelis]MCT3778240.1 hypothetical protein [Elizabethkingia anophelis]MCT3785354.1 hypothetical protein [Elizabethkingia anophelis]MCT3792587.1 hypothetical protein [Elizabethkingia anophelis]MCT3796128.1 hypothetical protein [Elizabethkingia anophelis]MCT3799673.1 hypothetical protein [Elizabethkingia anophelis]